MLSFWETQSFTTYDYCIVGSGITGLSLACELADAKPNASILLLDAGLIPTGASTKNAGFACFGSIGEWLDDLKELSEDELLSLIEKRWKGLEILLQRLTIEQTGFAMLGGNELFFDDSQSKMDQLLHEVDRFNKLLKPIFGDMVLTDRNDMIFTSGLNLKKVKMLIHNVFEGQVNTGLMMKSLMEKCRSLGVTIITGAKVILYERNFTGMTIVAEGMMGRMRYHAAQLAICTNAFTGTLLPELEINPGRGQVLITKPIPRLRISGNYHFKAGYYYFRNVGDRLLFGGGRHLDFEQEASTEFALNQRIQDHLESIVSSMILTGEKFEIEQRWTGIMAFGPDKTPIVKKLHDHLFVAARLNGMGVALGSSIARDLAKMMLS